MQYARTLERCARFANPEDGQLEFSKVRVYQDRQKNRERFKLNYSRTWPSELSEKCLPEDEGCTAFNFFYVMVENALVDIMFSKLHADAHVTANKGEVVQRRSSPAGTLVWQLGCCLRVFDKDSVLCAICFCFNVVQSKYM